MVLVAMQDFLFFRRETPGLCPVGCEAEKVLSIHSKIPFVSAVTPLALPRGGADIRIMR